MSTLANILPLSRCILGAPGGRKKRVLGQIASLMSIALPNTDPSLVLDSLLAREQLGSSAFGNGVAIPHWRFAGCKAPLALLIRLDSAVDFDALDAIPVDLLLAILMPTTTDSEHLELLNQAMTLLDNSSACERLRQATTPNMLYQNFLDTLQESFLCA